MSLISHLLVFLFSFRICGAFEEHTDKELVYTLAVCLHDYRVDPDYCECVINCVDLTENHRHATAECECKFCLRFCNFFQLGFQSVSTFADMYL